MIYFDIETIPTERKEIVAHIQGNIKAPANYKDPEKIEQYKTDNADKEVRKTGLSGLFGQVICIAYAHDNEPVRVITGSEKEILTEFNSKIATELSGGLTFPNLPFVGHNIRNFDVPFLCQRAIANGVTPLFNAGDLTRYDKRIADTMELFQFCSRDYYSLENICLAIGVESSKTSMKGSEVYDYYLAGKLDEIAEYCKADVEVTRKIYSKIMTADTEVAA